jgi:hypothetical protein
MDKSSAKKQKKSHELADADPRSAAVERGDCAAAA